MEQGVEYLTLGKGRVTTLTGGEVTLDIRTLIEYNGRGKCKSVDCASDTLVKYGEELRTWATSINWKVTCNNQNCGPILQLRRI